MAETVIDGPADASGGSILTNPDGTGGGVGPPGPAGPAGPPGPPGPPGPAPGGFTPGSILFADALGNISEDNPRLFYDAVNGFVGIGTNAPSVPLEVFGTTQIVGPL